MKIVVMSDTHLNRVTEEFISVCDRYCNDADMVIHLGDWERAPILDYMERYPLEAVAGNMDDHVIRGRLPTRKVIRAGNYRLGIVHGWGSPVGLRGRLRNEFTDVDCILFGHTHQPLEEYENGLFWFNPGSVTMGRGDLSGSLGILRIQERIDSEIIPL
jgi:putative phosphoesterase